MAPWLLQTAARQNCDIFPIWKPDVYLMQISIKTSFWGSWWGETPPWCTWVRMRTVSPSPQSGGCVHSHLDPFQTPVERKVIRDEDPLCTLVTHNASQNYNQCTNAAAACQKSTMGKQARIQHCYTNWRWSHTHGINNKVTSFKKESLSNWLLPVTTPGTVCWLWEHLKK